MHGKTTNNMNTYGKFVWHMANVYLMKTGSSVQCDNKNHDDDNDEEDVHNKI